MVQKSIFFIRLQEDAPGARFESCGHLAFAHSSPDPFPEATAERLPTIAARLHGTGKGNMETTVPSSCGSLGAASCSHSCCGALR